MKKTKVVIDDMNFYVVGNEDEKYIRSLANKLDNNIKEVKRNNYRLNQMQAVLLASLNLLDKAEKNQKILNEAKDLSKDEEKLMSVIEELENQKKSNAESTEKYRAEFKKNRELADEINTLKEENKNLISDINQKKLDIKLLKEDLENQEKSKKKLHDTIYENQKQIIELSRRIENLTNEDWITSSSR